MKFWKETMAPSPHDPRLMDQYEEQIGIRFPGSYRTMMEARNGGLIRTGFTHWWLVPFPDSAKPFPQPMMWMGSRCVDLPSLEKSARGFKNFPAGAVPIGLRKFGTDLDLLCFLRDEATAGELAPRVWRWTYRDKPLVLIAEDPADLVRDNPFRMPKPKQDWKLKKVAVSFPAIRQAVKSRKVVGTAEVGETLGWFSIGAIELTGNRLAIADSPHLPRENSNALALAAGSYHGQVELMSFGLDRRIGRVRILRGGAEFSRFGSKAFDVDVDHAAISFVDLDPVLTCEEVVLDRLAEKLFEHSFPDLLRHFSFGPTQVLMVASGFGDGGYPAVPLIDGNEVVGVEVRFIPKPEDAA